MRKKFAAVFLAGVAVSAFRCGEPATQWQTFNRASAIKNRQLAIADLAVQAICKSGGRTWFGLAEGLLCFDAKEWTGWSEKDGLPGRIVWGLADQGDSLVWIAAEDGIAAFYKERILADTSANRALRDAASVLSVGDLLYIGTASGLFSVKPRVEPASLRLDALQRITLQGTNPEYANNVRAITSHAATKALWLGTYEGAVRLANNGEQKRITTAQGLPNDFVYDIFLWNDTVWVATPQGIGRVTAEGAAIGPWPQNERLSSAATTCVAAHQGSIWIGTINGANRYDRERDSVSVFGTQNGLANNAIRSILADGPTVWFGCVMGGITRYQREALP